MRVLWAKALSLTGSILGLQPQIIELLAFGAIANKWALRIPEPLMSSGSPRSLASCLLRATASSRILEKMLCVRAIERPLSNGILFDCR